MSNTRIITYVRLKMRSWHLVVGNWQLASAQLGVGNRQTSHQKSLTDCREWSHHPLLGRGKGAQRMSRGHPLTRHTNYDTYILTGNRGLENAS